MQFINRLGVFCDTAVSIPVPPGLPENRHVLILVGLTFFTACGVRSVWGWRTKIAAFFSRRGDDADTPEQPDA